MSKWRRSVSGFGPRLFGFRRGETDYRVSLILFGGYVKMAGEQFAEMTAPGAGSASGEGPEKRETGTGMIEARRDFAASLAGGDPRNLLNKPRWQRLIISFAGPFMNLVLAVGLLTGLFMVKYEKIADANMEPVIGHVVSGSPAAKAGIQDGDKIVALNGQPNPTWEDRDHAGDPESPHVHLGGSRRPARHYHRRAHVEQDHGHGIRRLGRARRG